MRRWGHALAALALIVGIVLLPLRAVAATMGIRLPIDGVEEALAPLSVARCVASSGPLEKTRQLLHLTGGRPFPVIKLP